MKQVMDMERPKIGKSGNGMFDGIKSKLGFTDASRDDYDDESYEGYREEYGEYGDDAGEYGEYGPDYDEGAAGTHYDPYAPVTTRPAQAARRASRGADTEFPKLVSIDDVRAHTQVPDALRRDPLPPRRVSTPPATSRGSHRGERRMIDSTSPAPSSPAHSAATRESQRERTEGLDSLFAPSASAGDALASARSGHGGSEARTSAAVPSTATTASFDPYEAYAGSGTAAHSPSRSLTVFKPSSYGEVERIAKILKAGDVVVLALRNTPDPLAKRILDFTFGVSSALDASVECISDKVFSVTRVSALTDAERIALRNQGVL